MKGERREIMLILVNLTFISSTLSFWSTWGTEKEYKVLRSFKKIYKPINARKAMC